MRTHPAMLTGCLLTLLTVVALSACTSTPGLTRTTAAAAPESAAQADLTSPQSVSPVPTRSRVVGPGQSHATTVASQPTAGSVAAPSDSTGYPPGLYGMAAWHPTSKGNTTTFSASGSCATVLNTLAAGQWLVTTLTTPKDLPDGLRPLMPWYLVSLARGPQAAYLKLVEGEYDCDGTLIVATKQPITVTGAERHDGTATFIPFQCGPNPFDRESLMLTGFYDSVDIHMLVNLTLPAKEGTHRLDAQQDVSPVQVVHGTRSMLERYGDAFTSLAITDGDAAEAVPGAAVYRATDTTLASVTTGSLYPLHGTVHLTGLRGEAGGTVDLTVGFDCDTEPLPEPAAAGAPGDEPTAPLDGDASASTDGEGKVTVTVASGPRKGTHTGTGSLKCHHHRFGQDSWWLVFADSTGSEDPDAVTMINLWSQPKGQITKSSVYQEPFLLDVGFGVFVLDSAKQMHVNADVGGTGGTVTVHGNTVTATATTADKVTVTVIAECS